MHIGRRIEEIARQKNVTIVFLSKQLCCSRTNVYKIFDKSSLDTALLMRISLVLDYDFFAEFSAAWTQERNSCHAHCRQ